MTRNPDAERSEDGEPEPGNGAERPPAGRERPEPLAEEPPAAEGAETDAEPASLQKPARREPVLPADEEAAWAAIVAGYGREPDTGGPPASGDGAAKEPEGSEVRPAREPGGGDGNIPVRSFTVYAAGTGPRDYRPDDGDEDDEGHFVPPEPPPLPETDPTTKFAWLAALGGPLLLFACMVTQTTMNWWLYTLGIGGFLGGFATLVARMRDDGDEDEDDPGRGAVV